MTTQFCIIRNLLSYKQALAVTLGPEEVSILQGVLIKWVNFKENVWSGSKKTVPNNECPLSLKRDFTVLHHPTNTVCTLFL